MQILTSRDGTFYILVLVDDIANSMIKVVSPYGLKWVWQCFALLIPNFSKSARIFVVAACHHHYAPLIWNGQCASRTPSNTMQIATRHHGFSRRVGDMAKF
jgi:hypothetical protein